MQQCKDSENEAQFVPLEMKNNMKPMSMEKGSYSQVVKLRRKDLKLIAADKNKNEAKFKFQGKYARSQRLFDIDFNWIEVNFSTRETDLYFKNKSHDDTQDTNILKKISSSNRK